MIKRKLAMAGRFACLYTAVLILGSAIFGIITKHVGDYQLPRLIIMSSIAALIMTIGVTFFRARNRSLLARYREASHRGHGFTFIFTSGEFVCELLVTVAVLCLAGLLLAFSGEQLLRDIDVANTTLASWVAVIGSGAFLVLDLISWAIVCAFFRAKT